jgi:putative ABC transport system permease protein
MVFVENQLSYDRYHVNAGRIYRFVADIQIQNNISRPASVSSPEGPALKVEFPEIERVVRFFSPNIFGQPVLSNGDRYFREAGFRYADSSVFDMFTIPLLEGDRRTALNQPNAIVLNQTTAKKYFGDEEPLGKPLMLDGKVQLKVTGVMEDLPENTHLSFSMLASIGTLEALYPVLQTAWNSPLFHTYVLLKEGTDPHAIESTFPAFAAKYIGTRYFARSYELEPLRDIQLYSGRFSSMKPPGNISDVYVFSAIGVFILLLACINFMNISTARSLNRAREVGMRKVLGADRAQIMRQFMGESILMTLAATVLAVGLTELAKPVFESISGHSLQLLVVPWWEAGGILLLLTLIVGFIAGSYPSLFLSRFHPIETFRFGRKGQGIRKGLVVFQFGASVTLIICTFVVYNQLMYVRNASLGFDKEHIVVVPIGINEACRQIDAMKTALTSDERVMSVTASFGVAGVGVPGMDYWRDGIEPEKMVNIATLLTDQDFMKTYGVELKSGRFFSRDHGTDPEKGFVINETAAKKFGWDDPIGKRIQWKQPTGTGGYATLKDGEVIGVVKDFHYSTLQNLIQPVIIHQWPDWQAFNTLAIRIRPGDVTGTVAHIEKTIKRFAPDVPVDWYFLDESINQAYQSVQRSAEIFMTFATVAIVIACLGLFALAAFTAEQRTKEIGIRKVLGASASGVVSLLSRDFLKLVVIGNAIAWPLGYYLMSLWLGNFAYRIDMGIITFLVAGFISVAIAQLTVSVQAIRAAVANPVDALRYE